MSPAYSPERKKYALHRLDQNFGDVIRTSRELGISDRTLYKWKQDAKSIVSPPPQTALSDTNGSLNSMAVREANSAAYDSLPPDDLEALRDLKAEMLNLTKYIIQSDRIKPAIDAAPLQQRVTALTQLIDRIIKLAAQLALSEEEDVEILVYDKEETDEEETEVFADETASEAAGDFE